MQMTNRKIGYLVPCLTLALLTACGGGGGGSTGGAAPGPTTMRSAYAYVANFADSTISQYTINASTGALTPMNPATVCAIPSQSATCLSANPASVAVDPAGKYAYVTNQADNSISQFKIGTGGGLVQIGTGTTRIDISSSGPTSAIVDPTGKYLYEVNNASNDISVYSIAANGALTWSQTIASGAATYQGPVAVAVDHTGNYLYVANMNDNSITQFSITNGMLTGPQTTVNYPASSYPVSIAVAQDSTGKQYVYVANQGMANGPSPNGARVFEYLVGTNGGLTQIGSIQAGTMNTPALLPTSIAVAGDSTGSKYVYVTNGGAVSQYIINPGGTLAAMTNPTIPAGVTAQSVTVDITGSYVYVANLYGSSPSFNLLGTVSQYSVGPDGSLMAMSPTAEMLSGSSVTSSQPFSITTAVLIQ